MLTVLAPGRVHSLPQPRKRTTHLSRGPITRLAQIKSNRRVRIRVLGTSLGACPTLPFVTRRRRCGQMRRRTSEADPRFTVLGGGLSTTKMVGDRSPQRTVNVGQAPRIPWRRASTVPHKRKSRQGCYGVFPRTPPLYSILRGHIPMKGNEFTIRNQNRCIQLISQGFICCSPCPTAARKFLHTDW
jgi:hypothetical protein